MAKSDDKQFIIPFVGLKQGRHEFQFDITDTFFETFEYSIIQQGDVHIDFTLDKKDTMMVGEFQLKGHVKAPCDRCNDPIEVPIEGDFRLVYKFGNEEEEDETLVVVFPEEFEINIKASLLEFMSVLLPSRSVHDEGDCNQEMLDYLNEYVVNPMDEDDDNLDEYDEADAEHQDLEDEDYDENEEGEEEDDDQPDDTPVDPRWAALKNLKKD
ncbi:MAG: DUF177 domain-containing protein [Crocinitomicaceae bacterium]|nr:DUF177 domain-containing protein [Crocinitomicaceae bacterium]